MNRDQIRLAILCALLSNPARYEDFKALHEQGVSNEELTEKNLNKAWLIADAFEKKPREYGNVGSLLRLIEQFDDEDGDEQGAGIPAQAPRWLIAVCAVLFAALIVSGLIWRFHGE